MARRNGADPAPDPPVQGFKVPERTALIVFEEDDLKGCEVRCRLDLSLGAYFDLSDLRDEPESKGVRALYAQFAEQIIVSWNFIRADGSEIPATPEGFLELPPWVALAVMRKWGETATGVPAPLGATSSAGDTSAAGSRRKAK